ncbi:MAG: IS982 family transposase [Ktedonobacteraceae bacterium]
MITDFEDFCLWTYVIVDDLYKTVAPLLHQCGPQSECSDSELITMTIVGECMGWHQETIMLNYWRNRPDLFSYVPSRTRFNRRRRALGAVFNFLRQQILTRLDVALDRQCAIDSLPLPAIKFHLVPGSKAKGHWSEHGAAFGKVSTKKITIFGYKLHLLVTLNGVILDFSLAGANESDIAVGAGLLSYHRDLLVLGDKGYISSELAETLLRENDITLLTLSRANQSEQPSKEQSRLHNGFRQIVETINGQLADQFAVEVNLAHCFRGLVARLHSKLCAHTLCIYINRLFGNVDFLQIKKLAFPN